MSVSKILKIRIIIRSLIGRIERDEVNITLEKAYELAETLSCDIRDILP
ncbi:helix-turn-helix domain-containing protein [Vibrio cholerae]|nr:helix-turn-helix domain-containing protein [Vibrio cholerae]HAS3611746.1 helix-turn-helix domain-containing protein [Vibrio cholerae]